LHFCKIRPNNFKKEKATTFYRQRIQVTFEKIRILKPTVQNLNVLNRPKILLKEKQTKSNLNLVLSHIRKKGFNKETKNIKTRTFKDCFQLLTDF
jgi:hypothetical protein